MKKILVGGLLALSIVALPHKASASFFTDVINSVFGAGVPASVPVVQAPQATSTPNTINLALDPSSPVSATHYISPVASTDEIVLGTFDIRSNGEASTLRHLNVFVANDLPRSQAVPVFLNNFFQDMKLVVGTTTYTGGIASQAVAFDNIYIHLPANTWIPVTVYGRVAPVKNSSISNVSITVNLSGDTFSTMAYDGWNQILPVNPSYPTAQTQYFSTTKAPVVTPTPTPLISPGYTQAQISLDANSPVAQTVSTNGENYTGLPVLVFDVNAQNDALKLNTIKVKLSSSLGGDTTYDTYAALYNASLYQGSNLIKTVPVSGSYATFSSISDGAVGATILNGATVPYTIKVDVVGVATGYMNVSASLSGGQVIYDSNKNQVAVTGVANGHVIKVASALPSFSLTSAPSIITLGTNGDGSTYGTSTIIASFPLSITTFGKDVYFGTPNSSNPAFWFDVVDASGGVVYAGYGTGTDGSIPAKLQSTLTSLPTLPSSVTDGDTVPHTFVVRQNQTMNLGKIQFQFAGKDTAGNPLSGGPYKVNLAQIHYMVGGLYSTSTFMFGNPSWVTSGINPSSIKTPDAPQTTDTTPDNSTPAPMIAVPAVPVTQTQTQTQTQTTQTQPTQATQTNQAQATPSYAPVTTSSAQPSGVASPTQVVVPPTTPVTAPKTTTPSSSPTPSTSSHASVSDAGNHSFIANVFYSIGDLFDKLF